MLQIYFNLQSASLISRAARTSREIKLIGSNSSPASDPNHIGLHGLNVMIVCRKRMRATLWRLQKCAFNVARVCCNLSNNRSSFFFAQNRNKLASIAFECPPASLSFVARKGEILRLQKAPIRRQHPNTKQVRFRRARSRNALLASSQRVRSISLDLAPSQSAPPGSAFSFETGRRARLA